MSKDLTKLSSLEHLGFVTTLSQLPLSELRRRQDINQNQIATAFRQRNDLALGNCQVRERHLYEAINMREFKD